MNTDTNLSSTMLNQYGPIIGGGDLYSVLGFKTYAAFHRAKKLNELGVEVFKIEKRKGWFALTTDIANWILKQSDNARERIGTN